MAESQLACLEDGHIGSRVPESEPGFYYSEEQRGAVEELLRHGDGAFKTRLQMDHITDFLSAREVKLLLNTFQHYDRTSAEPPSDSEDQGDRDGSGLRSTYWPQRSDTDVPPLDMGWPGGGFFKGVTRVAVHVHPPRDGGPHIKEVVRQSIQGARKVVAIVMDLLTDVQILQDLLVAAGRRSVPVYILLDVGGVPHFLDMCSRLNIGPQHLKNIRTRTLQGTGFNLSFGRLPGSLCNKYMLVDGDKVVFGSYSYSWCTSRMDRNMVTVMSGQVVDFFDRDFRELYAVSERLNLYQEFHISPPPAVTAPTPSKAGTQQSPLPTTTSRFQVSLGDSRNANIQVPAHKYHNPKYFLVFGDAPPPGGSLQEAGQGKGSPNPPPPLSDTVSTSKGVKQDPQQNTWRHRFSRGKSASNSTRTDPSTTKPHQTDENTEDSLEVKVKSSSRRWGFRKMDPKNNSVQDVNADNESVKSRRRSRPKCKVS